MEFANTIISWFRENGRALPWRETRDPYAIRLSEIILQQTRIAQGVGVLGAVYGSISHCAGFGGCP